MAVCLLFIAKTVGKKAAYLYHGQSENSEFGPDPVWAINHKTCSLHPTPSSKTLFPK